MKRPANDYGSQAWYQVYNVPRLLDSQLIVSTIGQCIEILTAPDRARAAKLKIKLKQQASQSPTDGTNTTDIVIANNSPVYSIGHRKRTAFANLSSATSNIKATWNRTKMYNRLSSTHYLFRTSL